MIEFCIPYLNVCLHYLKVNWFTSTVKYRSAKELGPNTLCCKIYNCLGRPPKKLSSAQHDSLTEWTVLYPYGSAFDEALGLRIYSWI